jgi:fidgetin-like protein 1
LEAVVFPILAPHIFTGLRKPPKGLLLWGPPGTGKTMIGRAAAAECGATFFAISCSSLTSKWIGEGEKMVKTLFAVATYKAPSIIFVDEIDSMLTQRSEGEHESSRRLKTEFLTAMEGLNGGVGGNVLFIGATNRPQELDDAARRRFQKRFYVSLPDKESRIGLLRHLTSSVAVSLSDADFEWLGEKTEGFSGSDLNTLCREAASMPVRRIAYKFLKTTAKEDVDPILREHFERALNSVKPSVNLELIKPFDKWNDMYGTKPSESDLEQYRSWRADKAEEKKQAEEAERLQREMAMAAAGGSAMGGGGFGDGFGYGGGAGAGGAAGAGSAGGW